MIFTVVSFKAAGDCFYNYHLIVSSLVVNYYCQLPVLNGYYDTKVIKMDAWKIFEILLLSLWLIN